MKHLTHQRVVQFLQSFLLIIAALVLPAGAAEIIEHGTARVGVPEPARKQSRGELDLADLPATQSPTRDPALIVEMDKYVYEPGETPTLKARLEHRDGRRVEDADVVAVLDPADPPRAKMKHLTGPETTLPTTPGEHEVEVYADAVIDGKSVHRSTTITYGVTTGALTITGRGEPVSDGERLIVPLDVRVNVWGVYKVEGNLVAKGTIVATATTTVRIGPGDDTVPLTFNRADLVEDGPYRLRTVRVIAYGPEGIQIATAPESVGPPFQLR